MWDKFHGFRHITEPYSEHSAAGTQRIGWVLDEFEGCNIVKCDAATMAQAEDELLAPYQEPPGLSDQLKKLTGLLIVAHTKKPRRVKFTGDVR